MEDLPTIDKTPLTDDHIDSKSPPKQYWKLTTVIFGVLFIGAIALNIYSLRQKEKPSVAPSTASLPSPTETLKTSALFAMKDIVKNIQGDPVTVNVGDKHNAIAMVIFNPLPAEKKYSHVAINDQVTIYNFQTNEQKSYTSADLSPDDIVDSLNKYYADADKLGD